MSWLYALSTISVVALVVAWVRRVQKGVEGPRPALARTPVRQTAVVVIALLLLANVVAASRIIASDQLGSPPEQLWLIEGANPLTADLGFRADMDGGDYRVVLDAGEEQLQQWNVTAGPSEAWDTQLELSPEQRAVPLVARLYDGDSPTESRYVVLQPVASGAPTEPPAQSNAP